MDKADCLERICRNCINENISSPNAIKEALAALNHAKKAMLESSVFALQEGEALLEKLNQLWIQSSIDVRTEFKKESISLAIEQVRIQRFNIQIRMADLISLSSTIAILE